MVDLAGCNRVPDDGLWLWRTLTEIIWGHKFCFNHKLTLIGTFWRWIWQDGFRGRLSSGSIDDYFWVKLTQQ